MAFIGRVHQIQKQVERYRDAVQHAKAIDPSRDDTGMRRLRDELDKWENQLALQVSGDSSHV